MKNIYERFLNLSKALLEASYPDLDVDLCLLLESVFLHASQNQFPYTVSELIARKDLGSQATMHARLKKMIAMGYLELVLDPKDQRVKYVTLTEKSKDYFYHMNQSLHKALK